MKHEERIGPKRDLYRPLLIDIIDQNHELVRWRKRIGAEWMELSLSKAIEAAEWSGAASQRSMQQVIADTTVIEGLSRIPPILGCWRRLVCSW
jgi:hypothetical protein